jgi:hypothetical protein
VLQRFVMATAGAVAVVFGSTALAQTPGPKKPPPAPDSLVAISERGRLLAEHDAAAWVATDSVMPRRPAPGTITAYVARHIDGRWVVAFGRINAARDTFLTSYEVSQAKENPDRFTVAAIEPPRADTGYYARATRTGAPWWRSANCITR